MSSNWSVGERAPYAWTLTVFVALSLSACGKSHERLASVGNEVVTTQEFQAYLKFKRVPYDDKDTTRYQPVLDQYLQRKALSQAVERKLKSGDSSDAARLQAEIDDFRREAEISRYFESYLDKAVGDDSVSNYYNAHAAEFSERRVHVAHILLRTTRAMSEAERKAQLTKLQEAAAKIRSGQDFARVAEAYSEDNLSAKKGGDLGWIREGAIDPKLSEISFGTAAGAVSEPFETAFGFHLVKVLEAPQTQQRPLEAVKGDIRYRLRSEAKEAEVKKLLDGVKIKKSGV